MLLINKLSHPMASHPTRSHPTPSHPTRTHSRFTRSTSCALAVVAALSLSGCGSSSEEGKANAEDIATSGESEAGEDLEAIAKETGEDPEAPRSAEDAFALFNQCMELEGVNFPQIMGPSGQTDGGLITIEATEMMDPDVDPQDPSTDLEDVDLEAYEEAYGRCSVHLDNIDVNFELTPEEQSELADAELAFAECMAEFGLEVPDVGEGLGSVIQIADGSGDVDPQYSDGGTGEENIDLEDFMAASQECEYVFDDLGSESGSEG